MLKNPNYVYGPRGMVVPANLNFGDYVLDKMWGFKDKTAMIDGITNESVKYGEIVQQSMNFAISLTRIGVRKGDVVALLSENRLEYWGAVFGVACTGAVLTTLNTGYVKGEIQHAMSISKPKYIICSPTAYKNHEKLLKTFANLKKIILFGAEKHNNTLLYNDLAITKGNNVKYEDFMAVDVRGQIDNLFIIYSSGTTGMPKGVMLTHLNVITACCMPNAYNPEDLTLTISPWYHVMGLVGTTVGLVTGRTGVFLAKFDVDLYLKTIEKYKIAQLTVVPPVLIAVCNSKAQYDLSSVKLIYSGAAPLHRDTAEAASKRFPNVELVLQGYGSSETTLAVTRFNYSHRVAKPGSVGQVVTDTVIKVVDIETRKPLGPNQLGELCAKGELLMKGYIGKDRGEDFDEEGFYKTGDVGYYDEDGFFYIEDRLKELIKYKAFQVPPAELEAVLLKHEAVADVGVVGLQHKTAGEVPLAFVVLKPGKIVTEKELQEFVAERLSNPKHLRGGVRFINQIPKSLSGKILRNELRKMAKTTKSKL